MEHEPKTAATALLPCQFCGGDAEYWNDVGPGDESFWEWYQCKSCGARRSTVAAWNTRAPSHAALLAENKRLRAALSVILMNARLIPDWEMNGAADTYSVPIDDIEAARVAISVPTTGKE